MSSPESAPSLPGAGLDSARMPAHWLFARMGKRVLRPGGRELTERLIAGLDVTGSDDVVELAPGLGVTTRLLLDRCPRSYVGVEKETQAAAAVQSLLDRDGDECRTASAHETGLADASATVVFGEAFLTMQPESRKREIVAEAFRVLAPGGRYGLHELALRPDSLDAERQEKVRADMAGALHVGARPLTSTGWRTLLEEAGFAISEEHTAPMALLRPRRLIHDEGPLRAARFVVNVLRSKEARTRIRTIRAMLQRQRGHLTAIMLVATKPDRQGPAPTAGP